MYCYRHFAFHWAEINCIVVVSHHHHHVDFPLTLSLSLLNNFPSMSNINKILRFTVSKCRLSDTFLEAIL